jgi:hypothetical protein
MTWPPLNHCSPDVPERELRELESGFAETELLCSWYTRLLCTRIRMVNVQIQIQDSEMKAALEPSFLSRCFSEGVTGA